MGLPSRVIASDWIQSDSSMQGNTFHVHNFKRGDIMEHSMRGGLVWMALVVGLSFPSGVGAAGGTAQGETSDVREDQSLMNI